MSTPNGHKNLWKNIDWTNKDEKKAFFNKYFKGKELVKEEIDKAIKSLKSRLIGFIEHGEIRIGKEKRKINNADIIDEIKKL